MLQAARQRRRSLHASNGGQSNGAATTAVATAATAEDQLGSSGKSTVKKNWLRHRLFNMSKGNLKNLEDDESDATSRASSAADLQVNPVNSALQYTDHGHNSKVPRTIHRSIVSGQPKHAEHSMVSSPDTEKSLITHLSLCSAWSSQFCGR